MYLNFSRSSAALHHRVEAVVDLRLSTGADLVVCALEDEARIDELQADVVAQVGLLVDGADREVAALVRRLVGEVAALFDAAASSRRPRRSRQSRSSMFCFTS